MSCAGFSGEELNPTAATLCAVACARVNRFGGCSFVWLVLLYHLLDFVYLPVF